MQSLASSWSQENPPPLTRKLSLPVDVQPAPCLSPAPGEDAEKLLQGLLESFHSQLNLFHQSFSLLKPNWHSHYVRVNVVILVKSSKLEATFWVTLSPPCRLGSLGRSHKT